MRRLAPATNDHAQPSAGLHVYPPHVISKDKAMNTLEHVNTLSKTPVSYLDPYSDEALIDPWEMYAALQNRRVQ